ncbi:chromo-domain-containing protein [Xylona heveae TC161]|uniref:Chromo-domain-containing protein n=1 Tax=Xylona heveae (strain CBS 132557 / TC161) TaxID=1328760 RepID=A0A165GRT6_XYLHT|nr:chromo-domain-containing protein [Xylona heveae TC161]KZF22515.1 chromo-domain-containing protein [Xylona heveae TC161]
MPPIDFEEENAEISEAEDVIPYKAQAEENGDEANGTDDESEQGSEIEYAEYVVEEILDHKIRGGGIEFLVKWQGYENEEDQTWEPEANLDGAKEVLNQYFAKIGGRPGKKTPVKRGRLSTSATPSASGSRKRSRVEQETETESPAVRSSRRTEEARNAEAQNEEEEWRPPNEKWEDDIMTIDTMEQDETGLYVYLNWNNGRMTKHPVQTVYARCPMKMLHYYEQHISFTDASKRNGASR